MENIIQHFNKGEVIIPEGSDGDRTYRILSGEVLICKKNSQDKIIPIAQLGPGELFGEMYLFEGSGKRCASVIASSDVKVEVFFQDVLQQELAQVSPEVRQMLNGFSNRLQSTTGRYASVFRGKRVIELPDGTMKLVDNR